MDYQPATSQFFRRTHKLMDTDTPRTDELDREIHAKGVLADRYSDMLDHARELEREIDEMTAKQIELVNHMKLYRGQINNEGKHTASDALANDQADPSA